MADSPLVLKHSKDLPKLAKEHGLEGVDLVFTDTKGKLQHVTYDIDAAIDQDILGEGLMFDGSSIEGWKVINESDMILKPDISKICLDPFTAVPTLMVFCDVVEPSTGQPYSRCPRSIAKTALEYLKATGVADTAYFGPEAEFFIFDDVRFSASPYRSFYYLNSDENPYMTGAEKSEGNKGHRPRTKGGYFPVAPVDSAHDLRGEMLANIKAMGVKVEKHHHEVAAAQHELGILFDTLVTTADNMQLYKYGVLNTADQYGMTATFMPKPVYGDNGSGMHVHQSLWTGGQPMFAGDEYAGLSETCLYYIGGIIKHAKAINAFTNPTTNSYKRLVPGYEAPVILAYSSRNRSASCRIPIGNSPKAKRVEVRFPDPTANCYLGFAAMLMAGLDGIKNKIHPGQAADDNLYELPAAELAKLPTVCGSLREALDSLDKDRDFLLQGGVFSDEMISAYIDLKMQEVIRFEMTPHPVEFDMYYSS